AQLPPSGLPALRPWLLPRHPRPARPSRPRLPAPGPPPRPARRLLQAPLRGVRGVLQLPPGRPRPARRPLHPPGHLLGRPVGGRGRLAVPSRVLAPLARSPRLRPFRYRPELGRGG